MKQEISPKVKELISGYLGSKGLDLIELSYRPAERGYLLRIITDKPEGGIRLDECAAINRELGFFLEADGALTDRYTLEVSSPGADRPLSGKKDFFRCINRQVRLFFNQPLFSKWELSAKIIGVEDDLIAEIDGTIKNIPFSVIKTAKQILI